MAESVKDRAVTSKGEFQQWYTARRRGITTRLGKTKAQKSGEERGPIDVLFLRSTCAGGPKANARKTTAVTIL